MAAPTKTVTFVDGKAVGVSMPVGTYTMVSNTLRGYTTATAAPFTVTPGATQVTVKLTAAGTLTVHVSDDLDDDIIAGSLQLCSQDGLTLYGSPASIGTDGVATFQNVPYDSITPLTLWVKQLQTDYLHNVFPGVQSVLMAEATQTLELLNERKSSTVTVTAQDAVYADIVPLNGEASFTS